jgi:hypothetical protein
MRCQARATAEADRLDRVQRETEQREQELGAVRRR